MKSAEHLEAERALSAPTQPTSPEGDVLRLTMTREAAEKQKAELAAQVDRTLDRIMRASERGRTKKAARLYHKAVELQAAVDFLERALDHGFAAGEGDG